MYKHFAHHLANLESPNGIYDVKRGSMFGRYQMSKWRLVDLGIMERIELADGSYDFVWVKPWTEEKFLANDDNIQELISL